MLIQALHCSKDTQFLAMWQQLQKSGCTKMNTTLKTMKKQELGILVEFYNEFFEVSENITTIGNKKIVTKTKTKKFSSGHQVTWFAKDDWAILRQLFLRLQEYFMIDTSKHAKMRLVALD